MEAVLSLRQQMPKLGAKKIHHLLNKRQESKINKMIGRDKLYKLLKQYELLVERKRRFVHTTNSNHAFKKYSNLIKGIEVTKKDQVWVSDITYVKKKEGFSYVALITDVYSRKIVGFDVSDSLDLTGCVRALKMALKSGRPEFHHSDRGCQYCSKVYTKILKKSRIQISMTEDGNCYENAVAERLNGILKTEFNMYQTFINRKHVQKTLKQAVKIYNFKRPHWSIGLKTPAELYNAA